MKYGWERTTAVILFETEYVAKLFTVCLTRMTESLIPKHRCLGHLPEKSRMPQQLNLYVFTDWQMLAVL